MAANAKKNDLELRALPDADRKQAIFEVAAGAAQRAYVAEIQLVLGSGTEGEVEKLKKQADAAEKKAKAAGVEGPFFTDRNRRAIWLGNVQSLERMYVQAKIQRDSGIDGEFDPAALKAQHAKLVEIEPPEPETDEE